MLCVRLHRTDIEDSWEFTRGESWRPWVSESQLEKTFGKFGQVTRVTVAKQTQEFTAFVQMRSYLEAYHAFKAINTTNFGKIKVSVQFVNPNPKPQPHSEPQIRPRASEESFSESKGPLRLKVTNSEINESPVLSLNYKRF